MNKSPSRRAPRAARGARASQTRDDLTRLIRESQRRLAPAYARIQPVARWLVSVAWARLRPVLAVITGLGWLVLGLGVVAWLLAQRYGWIEMSVIAGAALLLAAVAALFMIGRTRVAMTVTVEPARVAAGDPVTGELRVHNTGAGPLLPVTTEVPIGEGGTSFRIPLLGPDRHHTELFVVPTSRRGVIPVGPVRTVRGDAVGLFRRVQTWTEQSEIIVHPALTPLQPFGVGLLRDLEGTASQTISMSDLSFHALREYVVGDDLRHVHWKSSARHGQLLVRQYLDTRRSHLVVIADSDPASYASEEAYELGISVAASLLRRGILDEYDASFFSGSVRTLRATGRDALDGTARAQTEPINLDFATREASQRAGDASLLILVTGTEQNYLRLQQAASHFNPDVAKFVAFVGAAEARVTKAGELPAMHVPSLPDLNLILTWGLA